MHAHYDEGGTTARPRREAQQAQSHVQLWPRDVSCAPGLADSGHTRELGTQLGSDWVCLIGVGHGWACAPCLRTLLGWRGTVPRGGPAAVFLQPETANWLQAGSLGHC